MYIIMNMVHPLLATAELRRILSILFIVLSHNNNNNNNNINAHDRPNH